MVEISKEVLSKACTGDMPAFEQVYRQTSGFVYNVAYRIIQKKEDAEEVVQEVFLSVYRNLKDFRFQSSFKTWIYRVTVNTAINYSKKIAKTRNKTVEYDEQVNSFSTSPEIEKKMEAEHHEIQVAALLDALNPEQRSCMVLRNIEGLSYQEISEVLQVNINTVRSRLKRARETLLALKKEVINHEL